MDCWYQQNLGSDSWGMIKKRRNLRSKVNGFKVELNREDLSCCLWIKIIKYDKFFEVMWERENQMQIRYNAESHVNYWKMEVIIDFINSILESVTYEQLMLQKVDNFSKLSILQSIRIDN